MRTISKIIIVSVMIIFTGACDNSLEENVYSKITEASYNYSEDDVLSVVTNAYTSLRDYFTNPQLNYWCIQEAASDEIVMPANASGWDNGGEFKRLHWHSYISNQRQTNNLWNSTYTGAISCNRIIEQLENDVIPLPSGTNKITLISEVRAIRALYYWILTDNWGEIPLVAEITQELPVKTARADVYQFLVTELTEAIPNLSEQSNQSTYGRMNKWAAKTLLANIYLNSEVYSGNSEWNKCLQECNDIINSNKYSLEQNYKDIFKVSNENSPEIIFSIPFDVIYTGGWKLPQISLHAASKKTFDMQDSPFGAGTAKAIPQFIDTYDEEDQRLNDTWLIGLQFESDGVTPVYASYDRQGKQLNYTKEIPNGEYTGEDEGYRIQKFEIPAGYKGLENDFPFFRYAQVLMMKAECLLRTGQADAAAVIVTEVRERAFKSNPEKATVTGSQLLGTSKYNYGFVKNYQIVDLGDTSPIEFGGFYDELGYEFVAETYRRRDMIRFGIFTKKSWLSHKPSGDYKIVLPLPQIAIDANPNLKQNSNYQ